jgi:DNA polymerase/3'-5' exonuclease PolX
VKLADAEVLGAKLVGQFLAYGYPRIEVVGSVRRKKPEPGDIEVLAVPPIPIAMQAVRQHLEGMGLLEGEPDKRGRKAPNGPRYYRKKLGTEWGQVQVDVFLVAPPAKWGLLQLIRTGDADFSREFVTRLYRFGCKAMEGRIVTVEGREVPSDTEEQCFEAAKLAYLPPEARDWSLEATRKAVLGP